MKNRARLILIILAVVLAAGCERVPHKEIVQITAVAPNYLKGILDRAAKQFKDENDVIVNIKFVPSDSVISRAKSGLKTDLFLIGNAKRFDVLKNDTMLVDSAYSCPFRLSVVLVGRADGPRTDRIDRLKRDEFRRIVIMHPDYGYEGRVAARVLNRHRLWNVLVGKMITAQSTEHLLSFLITKEADAAIMFESSIPKGAGLAIMQRLDDGIEDRLAICGAVTPQSRYKEVAQAFLDLLDSRLCSIYKQGGLYQYEDR